jgi:hypothetical protein
VALTVEWQPVDGAYGYNLYRSSDPQTLPFTLIAPNIPTTTYQDPTGTITDYYKVAALDRFGQEGELTDAFRMYTAPNLCRVYGTIVDVNGNPQENAEIESFVDRKDIPRFGQTLLLSGDVVRTTTNELGEFEIYLVRETLITIHIKLSGYKAQLAVPDQADLDINNVIPDFGVLKKVENPF